MADVIKNGSGKFIMIDGWYYRMDSILAWGPSKVKDANQRAKGEQFELAVFTNIPELPVITIENGEGAEVILATHVAKSINGI